MPPERRDPGRPTRWFGSGPTWLITRRAGEPSKRVHRTQAIAGGRVRRGRLLLGYGQHRVRTWHVIRGTRPARRPQAARILVAGGRVLHVPRFLVRIGLPHRRPTIIHQPTDAPETAALQVLIMHQFAVGRRRSVSSVRPRKSFAICSKLVSIIYYTINVYNVFLRECVFLFFFYFIFLWYL